MQLDFSFRLKQSVFQLENRGLVILASRETATTATCHSVCCSLLSLFPSCVLDAGMVMVEEVQQCGTVPLALLSGR